MIRNYYNEKSRELASDPSNNHESMGMSAKKRRHNFRSKLNKDLVSYGRWKKRKRGQPPKSWEEKGDVVKEKEIYAFSETLMDVPREKRLLAVDRVVKISGDMDLADNLEFVSANKTHSTELMSKIKIISLRRRAFVRTIKTLPTEVIALLDEMGRGLTPVPHDEYNVTELPDAVEENLVLESEYNLLQ
ncbi:unnamed protein product [Allacma fusca]|uniref:Uncharacterized protein n=1 Tax=Allacma fusca TaxID=39272 RepID=A0A8J2KU70_9HEXA|nr:unnamed protein product [Allacma fusca]